MTRKAALGIGIGAFAVAFGSYLLIQSIASYETIHITETGSTAKSASVTPPDSRNSTNPIKVTYSNFTIPYNIFNAKILEMTSDEQSKILLVSVNTSGAGNLTMVIPRALIDAKFGTHDDKYVVLVDGREIDYEESKTDISRTLTVKFPDGIQQIQVKEPSLPNRTHVANTNFSVSYNITNGKVLSLKGSLESMSMVISIESTDNGVLTITIPRGLVDSRINSQDDSFFVLIDGEEIAFQEIRSTPADRTLSIPFREGSKEIEIIGTWI